MDAKPSPMPSPASSTPSATGANAGARQKPDWTLPGESFETVRKRILRRAALRRTSSAKTPSNPCATQPSRPSRSVEEIHADAERRRRAELWRDAEIPRRHRDRVNAGPMAWQPNQAAAARDLAAVIERGGLVFLLGPYGTGKTQLVAAAMRWYAFNVGGTVRYWRLLDLIDSVRDEVYRKGGSEEIALARIRRIGFLALDEIDKRRWSEDESLWLERLIDHRYGDCVPTVLIANLLPAALQKLLPRSVLDRMEEQGSVIELVGQSLRGNKTAKGDA